MSRAWLGVEGTAGRSVSPDRSPIAPEAPDARWRLETVTTGGETQAMRVAPTGERTVVASAPRGRLTVRPTSADLLEARTSCGSPCSASVFVSARTGRVSEPFSDVLAVDAERVAVPTGRGVAVYGVWDAAVPLAEAPLPLSPVATPAAAVSSATFRADGTLGVEYVTGDAFEAATATLVVPPLRD